MNNKITWTKQNLAQSLNVRAEQGKFGGIRQFIMPLDISDDILETFQSSWDEQNSNPMTQEREFEKVYQAILAG